MTSTNAPAGIAVDHVGSSRLHAQGQGDDAGSSRRAGSSSSTGTSSSSSSLASSSSKSNHNSSSASRSKNRRAQQVGRDEGIEDANSAGHPFQLVPKRQSGNRVSFSEDIERHETMAPPEREAGERERGTESSADETTLITNHERTTSRRDYGTRDIAPSNGSSSVAGPSQVKRRKHRGRSRENGAVSEEGEEEGWWKKALDKYGSVELENKGSVARDHLALERTFLAWLRTSLSFASIGIAITQLFRLNTTISNKDGSDSSNLTHLRHVGKPLGATFIALSILILFIGFHRYFESQHYVIRGKFPASRGSIIVVAVIAGALIVASLVVVLAIHPNAFEKK